MQILTPCMHIHIVNSQDGGQHDILRVLKENNWEANLHLQDLLAQEQGFCQIYYLSVYVHNLGPIYLVWLSITPTSPTILSPSFPSLLLV